MHFKLINFIEFFENLTVFNLQFIAFECILKQYIKIKKFNLIFDYKILKFFAKNSSLIVIFVYSPAYESQGHCP